MDMYGFVSRVLLAGALVATVLLAVDGGREQAQPVETVAVTTSALDGEGEFANLIISSSGGVSLERVWLLVNGEVRGSLSEGSLRLRVYDGDILALDCREYSVELSFEIEVLSASVEERYLPRQFTCQNQLMTLGAVVMR